jgi:putative ABC transport system substrate-binding protein
VNGRRKTLVVLASAILAPGVNAQERVRRIAWFGAGRPGVRSPFLDAVVAGLREKGWEDGRNLRIAQHLHEGTVQESEFIARQIVASEPELIIVYGRDVLAMSSLEPPQPVVFAFSGDPVDGGIVKSFARPGRNFTGLSFMSLELAAKRIEVLREIVPDIRRLGILARPEHPGEHQEREVSESVASKLGFSVVYAAIQGAQSIDGALQKIGQAKCDALLVFPDGVMVNASDRIAKFAIDQKLPTISGWDRFADNGFLASYGPNLRESYRRLGHIADRVLRGAKPSDIPVEYPQSVEMVLNMRTAAALGLNLSQSVVARADRLIR